MRRGPPRFLCPVDVAAARRRRARIMLRAAAVKGCHSARQAAASAAAAKPTHHGTCSCNCLLLMGLRCGCPHVCHLHVVHTDGRLRVMAMRGIRVHRADAPARFHRRRALVVGTCRLWWIGYRRRRGSAEPRAAAVDRAGLARTGWRRQGQMAMERTQRGEGLAGVGGAVARGMLPGLWVGSGLRAQCARGGGRDDDWTHSRVTVGDWWGTIPACPRGRHRAAAAAASHTPDKQMGG
jgi:hypothetical protein